MKRLFVAVNLPPEIKDKIAKGLQLFQKGLPMARFIPPENWHITLVFLGYQDEESEKRIRAAVKEIADRNRPERIAIHGLQYGPHGSAPRMIWAVGEGKQLGNIKNDLEDGLEKREVSFEREGRPFRIHITVARFKNPVPLKSLPSLNIPIHETFYANGIDVIESRLQRTGAVYTVLEQYELRK